MSRVAKKPVGIPANVDITLIDSVITVKGPLGEMQQVLHPSINIRQVDQHLLCDAANDSRLANALSGTFRALVANMVQGVSEGFSKKLNLVGVGYRAQISGSNLNLSLGYSHPVVYQVPDGIQITTTTQTEIVIKGMDKQRVGQVAAEIRSYRKPEPYKGKGVRYSDEVVVLKETKKK